MVLMRDALFYYFVARFYFSFFCRLPGEAMQIDRVMDCFATHYCAQNPDIFEETDTCFILSFSIIMLNTALHNPNSKMKITSEQFIRMNKGINSGKDLAEDMLDAIFRNIKEEPFKIPDENYDDLMYTFFCPEREGWLLKQVCIDTSYRDTVKIVPRLLLCL